MFKMQALKPELRATSKQRKFYRILAGHNPRRGITRGGLNELIQTFPTDRIAKARIKYNEQKQASKFVKWILASILGVRHERISRAEAALKLHNINKDSIRIAVRAWRESGEGK